MFVSLYFSIQLLVPQIFESMKNSLKIERAKKNITQDDLAKAIGVSRQTINAMEANKYVPSTVLALKLAVYFACSVEEIFQLTEND
jgi:putative transcriptional regulator